MARRLGVSDWDSTDLPGAEREEEEVRRADEGLEDPPVAEDAVEELDEVVEGAALEGSGPVHPHREAGLWAGAGVCLEAEEMEVQLPQRRRRPSRRV